MLKIDKVEYLDDDILKQREREQLEQRQNRRLRRDAIVRRVRQQEGVEQNNIVREQRARRQVDLGPFIR